MSCEDCTCEKEECTHEAVYYCDCCDGIHCLACDEKWENHTKWRDYWYNAEDLSGPTHTFETVGASCDAASECDCPA